MIILSLRWARRTLAALNIKNWQLAKLPQDLNQWIYLWDITILKAESHRESIIVAYQHYMAGVIWEGHEHCSQKLQWFSTSLPAWYLRERSSMWERIRWRVSVWDHTTENVLMRTRWGSHQIRPWGGRLVSRRQTVKCTHISTDEWRWFLGEYTWGSSCRLCSAHKGKFYWRCGERFIVGTWYWCLD